MALLGLFGLAAACSKVPLRDVYAEFLLADASWFAEEETLFIFYEVQAEQGLGEPSVVEVRYTTDEEALPWTPLADLPMVHKHEAVDCGAEAMCGSASLAVPLPPREVSLRLRYHREGELSLRASTVFNAIGEGPAHSHRSLQVYGVFDEANRRVQWRTRHHFPTVRNERASALGLRREFRVEAAGYGEVTAYDEDNPYAYGAPCGAMSDAGLAGVHSEARAAFEQEILPLSASPATGVCAAATVTDATGEFSTVAVARKNPEVRPAFPLLRSPIREATPLKFFLGPCEERPFPDHEEMQRQRLQMEDTPTWCIDDWASAGFVDRLTFALRDAVEAARPSGADMVLVIGLQREEAGAAAAVEAALAQVVPVERYRASPRLVGSFIFDSAARDLTDTDLWPVALWCPSSSASGGTSSQCAVLPTQPGIDLGPFSFDQLPILPTRAKYLDFLETYSPSQAGSVTAARYLAPEFATTADHVDFGIFGSVTFLNDEVFAADADDAFSWCAEESLSFVVVRSPMMQDPALQEALQAACWEGEVPEDLCAWAGMGMVSADLLPLWHNALRESSYELGLGWDFPFLLQLEWRMVVAGAVSAFGVSVPFGLGTPTESYYGGYSWTTDEFPLDKALTQCERFCDHPTFDSAGVYQVGSLFREDYANACYLPRYPQVTDSGFPLDP